MLLMRDINHIVLDFEKKQVSNINWSNNFIVESTKINNLSSNTIFKKKIMTKFFKNKLLSDQSKFTLFFLNKNIFKKNHIDFKCNILINESSIFYNSEKSSPKNNENLINNYFNYILRYISLFFLKLNKTNIFYNTLNNSYNMTNIHFLRKERLYTKLKYSRSPAFDIVSGGAAALLAGFLGFLISEKFGFELVDSGDFYYLFMYFVFLAFSIRPLLTTISYNSKVSEFLSLNFITNFYFNLLYFFIKRYKI